MTSRIVDGQTQGVVERTCAALRVAIDRRQWPVWECKGGMPVLSLPARRAYASLALHTDFHGLRESATATELKLRGSWRGRGREREKTGKARFFGAG